MIRFQCLEGCLKGQTLEYSQQSLVIGRGAECDLCLDDSACSRRHARIELRNGTFFVSDIESTNGILVNGSRVPESALTRGDRFTLGRNLFVFLSEAADEPAGPSDEDSDTFIEKTISPGDAEERLSKSRSLPELRQLGSLQDNTLDLQELKRSHSLMQTLYRVSRTISASLESEDLHQLIVDHVLELLTDVERVAVFIAEGPARDLRLIKSVTKSKQGAERAPPVSRSVLERVRHERIGILASDASNDDRFASSHSIAISDLRSLMCVPLVARNHLVGAIYVENSSRPGCFEPSDLELLTLLGNQAASAIENVHLYEDLQVSFYETVRSLSNALEAKDKYTRGHSDRVARHAVGIGEELGLSPQRLKQLRTAAELHDIGKIAIGEAIIGKKGKLTEEEYELIKQHPQAGVDILEPIRFLQPVLPFILHHHERYNGKGYPKGLKGDEIPLEARILNLADAFDAMTTQRPYNVPRTRTEALELCRTEAGVSFDADCVAALDRFLARESTEISGSGQSTMEPEAACVR